MRSLYDYHQGEYMLVFDKLRNIPFWNADIWKPEESFWVETWTEIQIVGIKLQFALNEYKAIFKGTMKLVY
jgi:hypothetical protein